MPPRNKINLIGMEISDIQSLMGFWDQPPFRARQIYEWLYRHGITAPAQMSNLSAALRARLADETVISLPEVVSDLSSADGSRKFLFQLADGERVESVLIPEGVRRTLCISSQVGCLVGCKFCATGLMGFRRNLTSAEIVGQLMAVETLLSPPLRSRGGSKGGADSAISNQQSAITNVVMMGMGEPLLNRRELFQAARILCDPNGIGIPPRRFTISTVGWVPGIKAMSRALTQISNQKSEIRNQVLPRVKLAISLNATTDDERLRIMPLVARYKLSAIITSAREYATASSLPVAFNYLLLSGENDSDADAARLIELLNAGSRITNSKILNLKSKIASPWCKINLMEYNPVGAPFLRAPEQHTEKFLNLLRRAGLTVTLRTSRGRDISGACGQLAGNYEPGSGKVLEDSV